MATSYRMELSRPGRPTVEDLLGPWTAKTAVAWVARESGKMGAGARVKILRQRGTGPALVWRAYVVDWQGVAWEIGLRG